MNKINLLSVILFLLFAHTLYSQNIPPSIPKEVDIGVNGILIDDTYSVKKVLGESLNLLEDTKYESFPHTNYVNKDSTELLVLILHYGASKYEFSEFRITKFSKPFFEKYTVRPDAITFKTYKGLSLGMSVKEFNKILGNNLKEETEGDTIKFSYYLTGEYPDYENSPFLKFYNMPIYYGKYTFKDNHLIKIEFGFEYP